MLSAIRGFLGVLTILLVLLISRRKIDFISIKKNLLLLIISGACIGINWILLFEAYNYTTVAIATLCYYMAPAFSIIVACFIFKEKFTLKKVLCVVVAIIGMIGVSGVLDGGRSGGFKGVMYGLSAAVFYSSVILMNKKIKGVDAFDKTVVQLLTAGIVVLPYALIKESVNVSDLNAVVIILILTVGILNTGIAYVMYFGSMEKLSVETVSLLSYIDPVVSVLLSVFFLKEGIGVFEIIGIVLILGATVICELPTKEKEVNINE